MRSPAGGRSRSPRHSGPIRPARGQRRWPTRRHAMTFIGRRHAGRHQVRTATCVPRGSGAVFAATGGDVRAHVREKKDIRDEVSATSSIWREASARTSQSRSRRRSSPIRHVQATDGQFDCRWCRVCSGTRTACGGWDLKSRWLWRRSGRSTGSSPYATSGNSPRERRPRAPPGTSWRRFRSSPFSSHSRKSPCRDQSIDAGTRLGWYTSLGHRKDDYAQPEFRRHLLGGIQSVVRDGPRDYTRAYAVSLADDRADAT